MTGATSAGWTMPSAAVAKSIAEMCHEQHEIAVAQGFYEDAPPGRPLSLGDTRYLLSLLCLVNTEVAEAAEELRLPCPNPNHFLEELADICLRTFELAGALGLNLEYMIEHKLVINRARGFRHGGKRA